VSGSWSEQIREQVGGGRAGGYRRVDCPACASKLGKPDRKRSCSVNTGNGWWRCWRCDTRGRLPGDWGDADETDDGWEDVQKIEEPSDYVALDPSRLDRSAVPGAWYLRSRGVSSDVWVPARLGYARTGEHAGRVIFPVWGSRGENLGWVGRSIGDAGRRYHTASGMDRRSRFYGDHLIDSAGTPLVVVEGVFDALALWPNAVACLGKPTPAHVGRLSLVNHRPVVVVLDGDAWREGVALAERLRFDGVRAFGVKLPPGSDPASLSRSVLDAAISACTESFMDVEVSE